MGVLARIRSSITYPIAATLVLLTVVPVVVVGLRLAAGNREHLTTVEKISLNRQAIGLAAEVSRFFSAHRTRLVSTATALGAGPPLEAAKFPRLLQNLAGESTGGYVYLRLLDRNGAGSFVRAPEVAGATEQALVALLDRVHPQALAGAAVEQVEWPRPVPSAPVVILAYPLRSPAGEVWATLEGVVDLGSQERALMSDRYRGLRISVVDDRGKIVLSHRPEQHGKDMSVLPLVADVLRHRQWVVLVYRSPLDAAAGEILGAAAPIEDSPWAVVVERPAAEAFATVRDMQRRTVLVTVIAAVVALALGFALSRGLIRPLQTLADVTTSLSDGDLAVRADVSGSNEIARLAANFNNMAGNIEALVRRLRQALRQNQELFLETIRTLAAAIDAKDPYTRGHSERVSSYSLAIAKHLGLNQDEVFRVRIASILHDVGKLGIRDGILNKPGLLTDDEFAVMRRHPDIGAQIMAPIRMLRDIIPGIRNHHESWDGRGYPDRLRGEEIPLVARIIGIADTFDAMTTNRPYQAAMPLEHVLGRMRQLAGSRFDPAVIQAFTAAVEAGDITPPAIEPLAPVASKEVS